MCPCYIKGLCHILVPVQTLDPSVSNMRSMFLAATSGLRCSNKSFGLVMRLPLVIWWHPESFMEGVSQNAAGCTCTVYCNPSVIQFLYTQMNMNKVLQGCGYSCGGGFCILCLRCLCGCVRRRSGRKFSLWLTLKGLFGGLTSTLLWSKTSEKCIFTTVVQPPIHFRFYVCDSDTGERTGREAFGKNKAVLN